MYWVNGIGADEMQRLMNQEVSNPSPKGEGFYQPHAYQIQPIRATLGVNI
jgi:hypothetical protein